MARKTVSERLIKLEREIRSIGQLAIGEGDGDLAVALLKFATEIPTPTPMIDNEAAGIGGTKPSKSTTKRTEG